MRSCSQSGSSASRAPPPRQRSSPSSSPSSGRLAPPCSFAFAGRGCMAPDDNLIVGLDHVQIPIPDGGEDAVRTFYGGLLGLAEVPKPAPLVVLGGCWFAGKGVALHFGVEEDFRPSLRAHVALLLDGAGVVTIDDPSPIGVRR